MFVQSNGANGSMSPQQFVSTFSGTPFFNHTPFTFQPSQSQPSTSTSQFLNSTTQIPNTNQHKKIYIKNIDILKEPTSFHPDPSFTPSPVLCPPPPSVPAAEVRRSTLHLRTVDELNLMNINEVQNLIENFQEEPSTDNHYQPNNHDYTYLPDNNNTDNSHLDSVLQDLDVGNSHVEHSSNRLPFPIQTIHNSNDQSKETFHGEFDDIHTQQSNTTSKLEPSVWPDWNDNLYTKNHIYPNIDAPTTTTSSESTLNDYDKAYDKDILFVCAQEIINSSDGPHSAAQPSCMSQPEPTTGLDPEPDDEDNVSPAITCVSSEPTNRTEICENTQAKGRIYVVGNLMKSLNADHPETLQISDSPELMIEENDKETDEAAAIEQSLSATIVGASAVLCTKPQRRTRGPSQSGK